MTEPCGECGHVGENWVCLACGVVACSRYVNKHMLQHYGQTAIEGQAHHCVSMSFSDLSFWCMACNAYITHPCLGPLRSAMHMAKFGTPLPAAPPAAPARDLEPPVAPPPPPPPPPTLSQQLAGAIAGNSAPSMPSGGRAVLRPAVVDLGAPPTEEEAAWRPASRRVSRPHQQPRFGGPDRTVPAKDANAKGGGLFSRMFGSNSADPKPPVAPSISKSAPSKPAPSKTAPSKSAPSKSAPSPVKAAAVKQAPRKQAEPSERRGLVARFFHRGHAAESPPDPIPFGDSEIARKEASWPAQRHFADEDANEPDQAPISKAPARKTKSAPRKGAARPQQRLFAPDDDDDNDDDFLTLSKAAPMKKPAPNRTQRPVRQFTDRDLDDVLEQSTDMNKAPPSKAPPKKWAPSNRNDVLDDETDDDDDMLESNHAEDMASKPAPATKSAPRKFPRNQEEAAEEEEEAEGNDDDDDDDDLFRVARKTAPIKSKSMPVKRAVGKSAPSKRQAPNAFQLQFTDDADDANA